MLNIISKIFGGNKSDKDVKKITPYVDKINSFYQEYESLSNDELRSKTSEFKARINEYVADVDKQMADGREKAEALHEDQVHEREALYDDVDKLKKKKDELLEEILEELLPEAFAVVKQTAKRFKDNVSLSSTASDLDRTLAGQGKSYITIDGDQAHYANEWNAAGVAVKWNMLHYDVQLIGGTVLHQGKIAEMATGEGKTLVSTLPAYLNALAGLGLHIVTVNTYLAKRDQEWNTPIFEFLGITTDCIDKHQPNTPQRRAAYLADITYGTNNEFGFDYLRDNMVNSPEEMVQRKHHYAMVDEVDSVLIDDARTPLIISGPIPRGDEQEFHALKPRIEKIMEAQSKVVNRTLIDAKRLVNEGKLGKDDAQLMLYRAYRGMPKNTAIIKYLSEEGNKQLLQKAENHFIGEQQRHMPKVNEELYFTIDEKQNSVDLTEKGIALITGAGEDQNFFIMPDISTGLANIEKNKELTDEDRAREKDVLIQEYATKAERIHSVQQLLKAYTLFEKDVEYVVMDEKVKIVDEQTGRIMDGRRYSDGLHQALEAKENVNVEAATQTYATVTLQNYFRMYHKLCGMTGTAETEAGEFWEIYKLDVVAVPTNKPITRKDQQDLVYKTKREKYKAAIDEIEALRSIGRPVLVGTTSVEVSELLGRMLQQKKIPHNVLNAKQHEREAQVVAEAGLPGAVTIATNMAGRGTDIKLSQQVIDAGGLAIIGTERHESRRVDRQLRGRAGRQGDPGSSQFFVSLEDNLMRIFGSERIAGMMDKMGHKEGDLLQHSMISKSIERAQKKVEENNFGIRKRLLEYDDVMNAQREVVYKRRRHALYGERLELDLDNALYDVAANLAGSANDVEELKLETIKTLAIEPEVEAADLKDAQALGDKIYNSAREFYKRKSTDLTAMILPQLQQVKDQQGDKVQNIVIPFTDGIKGLQIYVDLQQAIDRAGAPIMKGLEKNITLAMIDDEWKEHLRAMDDLRTSVQMASYEQKDPLLIYKFEAFELFKKMLLATNQSIISFLYRAGIPMQEGQQDQAQQQLQHQVDQRQLSNNSQEVYDAGQDYAADENDYYTEPGQQQRSEAPPQPRVQPRSVEPKINRNDLCPCGSGKKYKACHGKMV